MAAGGTQPSENDDELDDEDREERDRILNSDQVDMEDDDDGEELIGDAMEECVGRLAALPRLPPSRYKWLHC